jgi:hypothetical protein
MLYKVVRKFYNESVSSYTVPGMTGLYLSEVQAHCQNPETSSKTCTSKAGRARTAKHGPWFDAYTEDQRNSR